MVLVLLLCKNLDKKLHAIAKWKMKMFSSLKLYTCIYLRRNHQCKQNNSKAGDLIFLLLSILLKVAHFNALIEISVHFSGMFYIFIILYAFVFFLNSIRKCLKIYAKYRREKKKQPFTKWWNEKQINIWTFFVHSPNDE